MSFANFFKPNYFLGCLKLETGGIIIGAVGLFYALLQYIVYTILFLLLIFVKNFCPQRHFIDENRNIGNFSKETQDDIKNITNTAQQVLHNYTLRTQDELHNITDAQFSCSFVNKIPFGILLLVLIIANLVGIVVHYKLIKGVEEFDPRKFTIARLFYIFFIIIRAFLMFIAIGYTFFSFKMLYVAIFCLVILLIDIYIYTTIDNLQIKYETSLPLNVATQNIHVKRPVIGGDNRLYS